MARPRKNDTEKRIHQLNFKLTDAEHAKVIDYAKTCGVTPADLVRQKIFTDKFPQPKIALIDAATYKELRKIGVNLNQAVRRLNQSGEAFELSMQCRELLELINKITNALLNPHDSQPG